jgi:Nitrate reductase delta subunit
MTGAGELWRALGAVADNPIDARVATRALGLPVPDPAEHTEVFVINCPPYSSIHLGPEGGIGGDAADRVAGFWRAIGLHPPPEPDHLASLFALASRAGLAGGSP